VEKHSGRIKNTIRNMYMGVLGQIVTYTLTFVYRTIFIIVLSANYLGIQGLFTNVLSILSLAELGIGSAITFSLYKPLADNDEDLIYKLMKFYAKAYKFIGLIVAVLGITLIPFLDVFIKNEHDIPYITIIYLLYLSDSVVSYFFSYKRSIIVADQKGYINTLNLNIFSVFRTIIQILLLIIYKNFLIILIVQVIFTFLSNISISSRANKLYPYLKNKNSEKLDAVIKSGLIKKIRAMFYHQLGSVIVLGTDNILISAFVGIYWVGVYSNYLLIIGIIKTIIQQFSQSVVASVGNLVSSESITKTKTTFDLLFFINYWIYYFCSICFLTLFNPFIIIWIGPGYLFDLRIVVVIVTNFYIAGMRQNVLTFRNVLGLYWYDRHKPFIEAIINLVVSIILLEWFGILGVFLGTLISTLTTSLWVEPYILFKYYFKSGLKKYFVTYFLYSIFTLLVAILMQSISKLIFVETVFSFILLLVICIIMTNVLFCAIFFKNYNFKQLINLVKKLTIKNGEFNNI